MAANLFIRYELFNSKALKTLSMGQFRIFFRLSSKIKMAKAKVRRRQMYLESNRDIRYPMRKLAKDEGVHLSTVQKAIAKLIEVGLIDIVHRGAAYEEDQNIYKLSDRWKLYGTNNFEESKPGYSRMRGWRAYHLKKNKKVCNPPVIENSEMEHVQKIKKPLVIRNKSKTVMPESIHSVS